MPEIVQIWTMAIGHFRVQRISAGCSGLCLIEAVYDRLSEFLAIDVPSDRNVQAEFMDACVLLS